MRRAFLALCLIPAVCLAQTQMWSQTYPNAQFWNLTRSPDGNVLAVGWIMEIHLGNFGLLWEFNADGMTIWDQIYYTGTNLADAVADGDGGYIAVGCCYVPYIWQWKGWTLKTDNLGIAMWQHFPCASQDTLDHMLFSVCRGNEGDYVAGGLAEYDDLFGTGQAWALKFDDPGDTLWNRSYSIAHYSEIVAVLAHPDSGYMCAANTFSTEEDTTYSPLIIRLSEEGDTLWTKLYDFPYSTYISDLEADPSGGYAGVGSVTYQTNPNFRQGWLAHFDQSGDTLDFLIYSTQETSDFSAVAQCPPDRWVLAGTQNVQGNVQAWLVYCESNGDTIWSETYGNDLEDWASGVAVDDSGYIYCAGTADYTGYDCHGWIFKVDPAPVGVQPQKNVHKPASLHLSVHPNPFNSAAAIRYEIPGSAPVRLTVHNVPGQQVATLFEGNRLPGSYEATFEVDDLPSGVYFLSLQAGERTRIQKVLLIR